MTDPQKILDFYLNLAELLQGNGASAFELSTIFTEIVQKHNFPAPEIISLPHLLSISIEIDGKYYSGNRRFPTLSPNIGSLLRFREWLPKFKGIIPDKKRLQEIITFPHCHIIIAFMTCIIQCVATCRFFGGDMAACFATIFSSAASFISFIYFGKNKLNFLLQAFSAALFAGAIGFLLIILTKTNTPLALLSASVIWLVPGLIMMNGFSDLFHGFIVSAVNRFAQSAMIVFTLLLGLIPVLPYIHPETLASAITPSLDWLWSGIAALACAYRFEGRGKLLLMGFFLGALGHGSRAILLIYLGMNVTTATLIAAGLVGSIVAIFFYKLRLSNILIYIVTIGIIPLIPGAALLKSAYGLLEISTQGINSSTEQITQTFGLTLMASAQVAALAIGGIFPTTIRRWISRDYY